MKLKFKIVKRYKPQPHYVILSSFTNSNEWNSGDDSFYTTRQEAIARVQTLSK